MSVKILNKWVWLSEVYFLVFSCFNMYLWTKIYQNGPRLINFDPNLPKRTVIGRFGPESTRTDLDWPIWTEIYRNRPFFANLDPNLFRPSTSILLDRPLWAFWTVYFNPSWPFSFLPLDRPVFRPDPNLVQAQGRSHSKNPVPVLCSYPKND